MPDYLFKKISVVLMAGLCLMWFFIATKPKHQLRIFVLNVGQGDAILIQTQDLKYILVDGGPDETVINELHKVIPLWQRNLDLVILSHPDQDHVGGLPYVMRYYNVKNVMFNNVDHKNMAYLELIDTVKNRGITHFSLDDSDDFQIGCCTYFDVVWPEKNLQVQGENVNNLCIGFVLMTKKFSMFFSGDLETDIEEKVFSETRYDLDVLKVGHHGSRTSTSMELLKLLKPETAVISVGKDNSFGHPHQEVIQYLQKFKIKIVRTDQVGQIVLKE